MHGGACSRQICALLRAEPVNCGAAGLGAACSRLGWRLMAAASSAPTREELQRRDAGSCVLALPAQGTRTPLRLASGLLHANRSCLAHVPLPSTACFVQVHASLAAAEIPLDLFDTIVSADALERLKPSPGGCPASPVPAWGPRPCGVHSGCARCMRSRTFTASCFLCFAGTA